MVPLGYFLPNSKPKTLLRSTFICPSFQYQPSKSTIQILLFAILLLFFIGENVWLAAVVAISHHYQQAFVLG
jgi:hypothetical protein